MPNANLTRANTLGLTCTDGGGAPCQLGVIARTILSKVVNDSTGNIPFHVSRNFANLLLTLSSPW